MEARRAKAAELDGIPPVLSGIPMIVGIGTAACVWRRIDPYRIFCRSEALQDAMRHSLRAHISYLETTIRSAQERLAKPRLSPDEIEDLELQLTLARSALEHYRRAYELELSVSGPEPPNRPDAQSKDGAGNGEDRSQPKTKGGLTVIAGRRVRKTVREGLPDFPHVSRKRMCA